MRPAVPSFESRGVVGVEVTAVAAGGGAEDEEAAAEGAGMGGGGIWDT